jgi:heparan-alpha-glucosaminide N-acetyltransferase
MKLPNRLLSIDVFRGITMLFMIFVNDASGVKNIPEWIDHVDGKADGMHFADSIFPTFLFIVGLSLPFALKSRMNKGESFMNIASYILLRSAALIIMGFFHVNLDRYHGGDGALVSHPVWMLSITLAFFLIWLDYPETMAKAKKYSLIGLGIAILLFMAYIYQFGNPKGMRPSWWGILGIIGWGYLVCAFIFLFVKGNLNALIIAFFALLGVNILTHMDLMPFKIPLVGDGSPTSLIMAGAVVSGIYASLVAKGKDKTMWILFIVLGVISLIAAFGIRPYADGISKIRSTPAWGLITIGLGILIFELLIWLVDVKKKENWFKIIRPAGTSTLTCYLIPYIIYGIQEITGWWFPEYLSTGFAGLARCMIVGLLIIVFVGFLEKKRLRLRV